MQLLSFDGAEGFRVAAESWLASAERENNLLLTALIAAPSDGASRGWLVLARGNPQLAPFQVPPHHLLLSQGNAEVAAWASRHLRTDLPGVTGPAPIARAFASRGPNELAASAS